MAVSVVEGPEGTAVLENGFNASYDVYLRPCSDDLLDIINVTMYQSVSGQIELNTSELLGADFNNSECKATVEVSAFHDGDSEGDHFATIRHEVLDISGLPILLTDNSPMLAANVLVQIYDNDIG